MAHVRQQPVCKTPTLAAPSEQLALAGHGGAAVRAGRVIPLLHDLLRGLHGNTAKAQRAGAIGTGRVGGEVTRSVRVDEPAAMTRRAIAAHPWPCPAIGAGDVEDRVARPFEVAALLISTEK